MAPSGLQDLKSSHIEELSRLRLLLHLLFHRNKNQHRSSAWWRFFAGFRRELGRFLEEVAKAGILNGPALHGKERETQKGMRERLEKRLELWRDVLAEKWYLSFSQLIASTQFSALGLVLLASLARVCFVTGITTAYQRMATPEVQNEARRITSEDPSLVVDSVSRGPTVARLVDGVTATGSLDDEDDAIDGYEDEDVGEVVMRDDGENEESLRQEQDVLVSKPAKMSESGMGKAQHARAIKLENNTPDEPAGRTDSLERRTATGRKGMNREKGSKVAKARPVKEKERQKKSRKKNAIDDIFGF